MAKSSYREKALMAVDFGSKFIGVSTYLPGHPCPTPYGRIQNKGEAYSLKELSKIAKLEGIEVIVVGVPKLTDGKETNMTLNARHFMNELQKLIVDCEVIEQDETLTTFEAKERMKRSPLFNYQVDLQKIDELSATIILEDFLKAKDTE